MQSKFKIWFRDGIVLFAVITLAVWLGAQLPRWYSKFKGPINNGDYSQHVKTQTYALTLYGTSTCPHCVTARRLLTNAGIPFNDLVVDKSKIAEAAYRTLGETAVPILLSEKKMVVGFNQDTYLKLAASVKNK
jgi:glutaredoxin